MNERVIETTDLYQGAYLLIRGNALIDARLTEDAHKKYVIFIFEGPQACECSYEFMSGMAKANINELRAHINHLKRLAFEKINED